ALVCVPRGIRLWIVGAVGPHETSIQRVDPGGRVVSGRARRLRTGEACDAQGRYGRHCPHGAEPWAVWPLRPIVLNAATRTVPRNGMGPRTSGLRTVGSLPSGGWRTVK